MPINVPDLQIFMQAWHINFAQTLKYRYFTKYQCARSANLHADLAHFCINYSIQLHRIDVWTCNKLCKQEATALFQVLFQCHQYASQRLTAKCAAHPRDAPLAALLDALLDALLAAPQAAPFAGPLAALLDDPPAAPLAVLLAACYIYIHQ